MPGVNSDRIGFLIDYKVVYYNLWGLSDALDSMDHWYLLLGKQTANTK